MTDKDLILTYDNGNEVELNNDQQQKVKELTVSTDPNVFYTSIREFFQNLLPKNFDLSDDKVLHFKPNDGGKLALDKAGSQTALQGSLIGPCDEILFEFK